jgi:hypothetical protein
VLDRAVLLEKAARAAKWRHTIWPSTEPVTSIGSGRSSFS